MSSGSASESCCVIPCSCDTWLTNFSCDYTTVSVKYCGVTTEFTKARSKGVKFQAVNPQSGVHPSDRIFRVSWREQDVEVGIGAVITDDVGTEWVVYAVDRLESFCVNVLWGRSVAACFTLLETIDVLEEDCVDCDCGDTIQYKRVARIKGKIFAEGGTVQSSNDSREIVYRFSGELVKWPLSERPHSRHRLKTKQGSFRIVRVADNGIYSPFIVGLEQESADCSVRGT